MKKWYVVFGVGYGALNVRPSSRMADIIFACNEQEVRFEAKKRWDETFHLNANEYGFIVERCEELAQ